MRALFSSTFGRLMSRASLHERGRARFGQDVRRQYLNVELLAEEPQDG